MLSGLFNYDNPVWRFIGKFGDLILLNILFVICSIPIFTIGASTTAVYYVTLKLARNDDGYTIRSFFKSFKENFKQSTIIWLILLVVGIILGIDVWFFAKAFAGSSTVRTVMLTIFLAMCILYLAVSTYIFPLQSRFYNTVKRTFFNAFFMSIRHLINTVTIVIVDVAIVAVMLMVPQVMMLGVLFGFPLLAFVNSYILSPVFAKYIPDDDRDIHEMRPLFADEEELEAAMAAEKKALEENPEADGQAVEAKDANKTEE